MALKDHNQQLTQITTETTSALSSEIQIISQFPIIILLAVFISLSIVANIFLTSYAVYSRRKRKNARKKEKQNVATDVRVRANFSLDKDFSDTSQVSKFNCKKMVNDVEEECTEKLLSESNLIIKRTSVDHQEHVIYIPNSKTEELRIENVQRQHQS